MKDKIIEILRSKEDEFAAIYDFNYELIAEEIIALFETVVHVEAHTCLSCIDFPTFLDVRPCLDCFEQIDHPYYRLNTD